MTTIDLSIGGYGIRLTEAGNRPCFSWPLSPFERFLAPAGGCPDIDIIIELVETLPRPSYGALLFDACHGLWRLYRATEGCVWESLDPETHRPRSYALIDAHFSRATVWTIGDTVRSTSGWVPMKVFNPLVEVCLLTKLAREGGLLLHAAGMVAGGRGYVFTGPSGAGKSTLSEFFSRTNATILSDERVILTRQHQSVRLHGTPWIGSGAYAAQASVTLTNLFCIHHGTEHRAEPMTRRGALSWILPQCFLPHWDRTGMEKTLSFLGDLLARIPCHSLAFAKDATIVEYVDRCAATSTVAV